MPADENGFLKWSPREDALCLSPFAVKLNLK
jgi:hypothetical protein